MLEHRAFSAWEIKEINEDQRIIRGIATSPTPDRVGDVVEPMGLTFAKDIPLFLHHDSEQIVGRAQLGPASKKGVAFEARIAKVSEPGKLRDRVDEAWQMVKYKLITAVSIGFRPVADKIESIKDGGYRFLEAEVLELSLVPIPAQPDATIDQVKAQYMKSLAGAGEKYDVHARRSTSGTSGEAARVVHLDTPSKPGPQDRRNNAMPTPIKDQISGFENKRAALVARTEELMNAAAEEGSTLKAEAQEEYDTVELEVKSIDDHLVRLRKHETMLASKAKPVSSNGDGDGAPAPKKGVGVIELKETKLPPGIGFARFVMCMHQAKGNPHMASMLAKSRGYAESSPAVTSVLNAMAQGLDVKTAVAGGTTSDANWAAPLVQYTNLASEFINYLRPQTIFGRLQGLRHVPFMTKIPRQTAGASGYWVGEQQGKPLSKLQFDSITMPPTKMATIVVISDELARLSSPSAEALVRDDLAAALAQFQDQQAFSPGVAGVANTNPASLTFGLTATSSAATGSSAATVANVYTDTKAAFAGFVSANINTANAVWLMDPATALGMATLQTTIGTPAFPDISISGGTLLGLPVIVSNNMVHTTSGGAVIVLISPSDIIVADDGGVTIDVSSEASLQMSDAPTASAASLVSMFQTNQIAIRAEQYINYAARRTGAVAYIDGAHYA